MSDFQVGDRVRFTVEGVVAEEGPGYVRFAGNDFIYSPELHTVEVLERAKRLPKVGETLASEHKLIDDMVVLSLNLALQYRAGRWHSASELDATYPRSAAVGCTVLHVPDADDADE